MKFNELAHVNDSATVRLFTEQLSQLSPNIDPLLGTVVLNSQAGHVLSVDLPETDRAGQKPFRSSLSVQTAWLESPGGGIGALEGIQVKNWTQYRTAIVAGHWMIRKDLNDGYMYFPERMTQEEIRVAVGVIATEKWTADNTVQPIRPVTAFDPPEMNSIKTQLQTLIPAGWGPDSNYHRLHNKWVESDSWDISFGLDSQANKGAYPGTIRVARRQEAVDETVLPSHVRLDFSMRTREDEDFLIEGFDFSTSGEPPQPLWLDTQQRAQLRIVLEEALNNRTLQPPPIRGFMTIKPE